MIDLVRHLRRLTQNAQRTQHELVLGRDVIVFTCDRHEDVGAFFHKSNGLATEAQAQEGIVAVFEFLQIG